jgi:hypothetical protein
VVCPLFLVRNTPVPLPTSGWPILSNQAQIKEANVLKEVTLSRILRYSYGGFLLVAIMVTENSGQVKTIIEALGSTVAPLTVVALGGCVFVTYRYVLGELLIFPVVHLIDGLLQLRSKESLSPIQYLSSLGVPFGSRRAAYGRLKASLFTDHTKFLDLIHSEIHILYITSTELIAFFSGRYSTAASAITSCSPGSPPSARQLSSTFVSTAKKCIYSVRREKKQFKVG